MTEEAEQIDRAARRRRTRTKLWLALALVVFLLAVVMVPPYISISRYKNRITGIVSAALGRPVHLSSVELRLLPWPGFVITDLTVDEDPAYGAEPVLHASTVTTAIRLESLWRGRLEISRISVDEASLNLVRAGDGRWNLDSLFRTAAARTRASDTPSRPVPPLPYLEATNSRINIKNGLEKLPYSLVNADVSFWQENPGDWRLRLRGQPSRTDVSLALADTGIVQLEASLRRAPELRQMPLHVEMEWREAQLGQLSRLILGSDPGWRGDLTGELQLDGTAADAQIKARLSASGVHRAEFAPADALDFDANCTLLYHYAARSIENLACDSPLGEGHIRVDGDLPAAGPGKLAVDVLRVPVSAGLDMLRTVRNGIADDLDARGTVSGHLAYNPAAVQQTEPQHPNRHAPRGKKSAKTNTVVPGPLQGSLTIEGFRLSGGGLSQPVQLAKIAFSPADADAGQPQMLAATVPVPAGGSSPLTLTLQLAAKGYQLTANGPAALPRLREFAHLSGLADTSALDGLAGDPAALDLTVQGPWLPPSFEEPLGAGPASADQVTGSIVLHEANWKTSAFANPVAISAATLHLDGSALAWDPVSFAYGPIKGTASLRIALTCAPGDTCPPELDLAFDQLDASVLQAQLLGVHPQGNALSSFIDRFTAPASSAWPQFEGTVKAGTLLLGTVTLQNVAIALRVRATGADFASIDAGLLGGKLHASGSLDAGDKPTYSLEGSIDKAAASPLCALFKLRCTGGPIDATGKLTLAGLSAEDLASSASGTLHFDWRSGTVNASMAPKALARFTRWTADGVIGHNTVILAQSEVQQGAHKSPAGATITFADPPKIAFQQPESPKPAKR
jgi:hypothetical protein